MASDELVSVVMSTYNDEKYIKEAINSILYQTYDNFEFIIIDDASTDKTSDILNSMTDSRIKVIRNVKNQGLTKNLNIALRNANGKYIARMDADDISLPTRFEKQLKVLRNSDYILVGSPIQTFGGGQGYYFPATEDREIRTRLLMNTVLPHPTIMFDRDVMDKTGLFYNDHYPNAQDYDFLFRIAQHYKMTCMDEVLLFYRVHDNQISNSKKSNKQQECAQMIRKSILDYFDIVLDEEEMSAWNDLSNEVGAASKNCSIERVRLLDRTITKIYAKLAENTVYDSVYLRDFLWWAAQRYCLNKNGKQSFINKIYYEYYSQYKKNFLS